jgi:hypothetical protein
MKYIGIDASKIKAKFKEFIDLTIFKEADHDQKVVLSTEQYGTDVELKITDGSTGDVVIECGTLP